MTHRTIWPRLKMNFSMFLNTRSLCICNCKYRASSSLDQQVFEECSIFMTPDFFSTSHFSRFNSFFSLIFFFLSVFVLHWFRIRLLIFCLLGYPLDCLFPFSSTVSSYNFRKPRQLILPTTRTSRYLNSFFYHSALLWNSLPSSIQSITKPNHFRQALTSHWREQKYQPVSQLFWLTNPLPHHFFLSNVDQCYVLLFAFLETPAIRELPCWGIR